MPMCRFSNRSSEEVITFLSGTVIKKWIAISELECLGYLNLSSTNRCQEDPEFLSNLLLNILHGMVLTSGNK